MESHTNNPHKVNPNPEDNMLMGGNAKSPLKHFQISSS